MKIYWSCERRGPCYQVIVKLGDGPFGMMFSERVSIRETEQNVIGPTMPIIRTVERMTEMLKTLMWSGKI